MTKPKGINTGLKGVMKLEIIVKEFTIPKNII
jgi:hypothetical protein